MRALLRASVTALSIGAAAASVLTATAKEARAESGSTESAATQGQNENHEETPQERRERRERRARREKEAADKAAADKAAAAEAAAATPAPSAPAPAANAPAAQVTPPPAATTAPATSTPASSEAGTPLSVIPSKPLNLESTKAPSMADSAWKLGALGVAAGLGFWALKRKKGIKLEAKDEPELKILRRTSLGNKNELVFVELEGQQILLGVTANAISSLLIIPTSDASDPIPVEEPVAAISKKISAIRESAPMFPESDLRDTDIQIRPRASREARPARTVGRERDRKPRESRDVRESREERESPAEIVLREEGNTKGSVTTASALARIEGQAEGLMRLRRNA